jgi:hypothetical protein
MVAIMHADTAGPRPPSPAREGPHTPGPRRGFGPPTAGRSELPGRPGVRLKLSLGLTDVLPRLQRHLESGVPGQAGGW